MVTDAKRKANARYRQAKRDQLAVDIPKGKKDKYKLGAMRLGLSLSGLIQASVEEFISRHAGSDFAPVETHNARIASHKSEPTLTPSQKKLVETFDALPVETQKAFLNLLAAVKPEKPEN